MSLAHERDLFCAAIWSSTHGVSEADRIRELEEALRQRDARITELEREVTDKAKVIEAWKRGHRVRPGGKLAQKARGAPTGRGPGRPEGHTGTSRPAPTRVDRDVLIAASTACPLCEGEVDATNDEPGAHLVEELIPARVEYVRYRRCKGRCRACRASVLAPLPEGLGANPKIGVRAQAEIVQARTELGLTLGQTQKLFARQGLRLSRGGLQQILHRSARVLREGKAQIQAAIPASPVAWADESSHKVGGASGYLWLVMTRSVVLYEADRSRGQQVAQRLLAGFKGTLHSDFYAVYWTLPGVTHAACWGHLCRSARQVAERASAPQGPTAFHDRLSGLYARGVAAQGRPATAVRNARAIRGDLEALARDEGLGRDGDVARLQRRILKHLDDLVAFAKDPALEGTNNRAEREFRPHAQARHRSGGARSDAGAATYATNLSVVRTVHLHDGDFVDVFRQARIAFHNEGEFPALFPPQPSPPNIALALS
jgi:transposase